MARFFKPQKQQSKQTLRIDEPLRVENLSDDGRGIARHQGKLVFIDNALPGESVKVRVFSQNTRFLEAKALSIAQPSVQRVEPHCPHTANCGGCSLQHMAYEAQYEFKKQAFFKQLQHQGHAPDQLNTLLAHEFGYRNRTRLGVSVNKRGEVTLGFRAKQSQQLINITECAVMLPVLGQLLHPLKDWLQGLTNAPVTHIELIGHSGSCGVVVRHTRTIAPQAKQALTASLVSNHCQTWFQSSKQGSLEDENGIAVDPRLFYPLGNLQLSYHPQDFMQANPLLNTKMVEQALSLLKPESNEHFADFFCGIGNFSLPLAKCAASVHGYEGVKAMVERATANAAANDCFNAHFLQADLGAEEASVYHMPPIDGMLLDPPRSGAKSICTHINKIAPKRIVYVSCNPATFARDAQLLCANGYELTASGLMDMFPQTSHSEVIGLFKK